MNEDRNDEKEKAGKDGVLFFPSFRIEKGPEEGTKVSDFSCIKQPPVLERINQRLALLKLLEACILELQSCRGIRDLYLT